MVKFKLLLFGLLILASSLPSLAQGKKGCEDALRTAREEFDHGHFYQINALVHDCIKNGFTKEQQATAHFLLTRTYLFLDKPDSAEFHYLQFLKLNPLYRVNEEKDPIDIIYLSENFTTTPIFSLNFKLGLSMSDPVPLLNYIYTPYTYNGSVPHYKVGFGMQIPVGLEMHLGDYLTFGTKFILSYNNWRYKHEYYVDTNFNEDGTTYEIGDSGELREAHFMIDIPVSVKYIMDRPKWRPFIYGGYNNGFLMQSNQSFNYWNIDGEIVIIENGPRVSNLKSRHFYNPSLLLGGGVMYQVGKYFVTADMQVNLGLRTLNDPNQRYIETDGNYSADGAFLYSYVDNNLRINTVKLNLGLVLPLYKPRKKEDNTIRDLIKNIKSEK